MIDAQTLGIVSHDHLPQRECESERQACNTEIGPHNYTAIRKTNEGYCTSVVFAALCSCQKVKEAVTMLSLLSILAISATILASPTNPREDRPKYIPGKYLVQLQSGANAAAISTHHDNVRRLARRSETHEPIERTFNIGNLNAYLGDLDEEAAAEIASLKEVLSVVPDEYMYLEKTDFPPLSKSQI